MKSTGVSRKIDDLGRLVLPAEIRRRFGLSEGAHVEISVDGDRVILTKVEAQCVFCGDSDELQSFRGKRLCANCLNQLTENVPTA